MLRVFSCIINYLLKCLWSILFLRSLNPIWLVYWLAYWLALFLKSFTCLGSFLKSRNKFHCTKRTENLKWTSLYLYKNIVFDILGCCLSSFFLFFFLSSSFSVAASMILLFKQFSIKTLKPIHKRSYLNVGLFYSLSKPLTVSQWLCQHIPLEDSHSYKVLMCILYY